jgi:hypothetical protein
MNFEEYAQKDIDATNAMTNKSERELATIRRIAEVRPIEGAETCPKCYGTGTVSKGPRVPKPELPKALVEHMRRAWWDFFNKGNV